MPATLVRRLNESPRNYYFDFGLFPEIADDGETVSSVVSVTATPSGLTLSAGAVSGHRARVAISGGVADTTYTLRCVVATSGGSRLECSGLLRIAEAQ